MNAFDGNDETDWATKSEGRGSWIKANLFGTVMKFSYRHRTSKQQHYWNKDIRLEFSDGTYQSYQLKEESGVQMFTLTKPVTTTFIKITVTSHYHKNNNGAVEIEFFGCSTNVDECKLGTHNCAGNATCTNTDDGYTCTCDKGFFGNGKICADVNECTLKTHKCHSNSVCSNTNGSYTCSCNQGYSGDGKTCEDVDECRLKSHKCHTNAVCTNDDNGYTCTCIQGYSGDGKSCTKKGIDFKVYNCYPRVIYYVCVLPLLSYHVHIIFSVMSDFGPDSIKS